MSGMCQSQVIAIEDDDVEEDVEVVFSNLDKSHVYRNLMQQKLSEEMKLLQAMSKQLNLIPDNFDQFKKLANTFNCQYGDDVILSAWQRIMNKLSVKLSSSPNNIAPVCLVRPLQLSPEVNLSTSSQQHRTSSPALPVKAPISSPLGLSASAVVPIALIKNTSMCNRKVDMCTNFPNVVHTIEVDDNDTNDQFTEISCPQPDKQVLERYSGLDTVSASDCTVYNTKNESKQHKSKSDNLITDLHPNNSLEESNEFEINFLNTSTNNCDSVYAEKTQKRKRSYLKRRSLPTHAVSAESPETDEVIHQSHVGVKAKIVRAKQTSPTNSRKRLSATKKVMSDAELKEFKAEQKKLKLEQKREFEIQQLQKVHDRLVDVLIPKYYKQISNENS